MSDPQRYSLSEPDISYGMDENSNGSYVLWTAYARLKAENARLRKAGDAMAEDLIGRYFGNRLVTEWKAAKEGTQS